MFYTYEVCAKCGKILYTRKTTGTGVDTVDGETYIKSTREHENCEPTRKEKPDAWYNKQSKL